ncbi:LacI family DNA-binding transcriptional regulator [Microbacterium elymi]|uniref:LacI family DNA-binding transcriptional regulator n=1 Tax=Microbacterium elymi TaxID=2909587 RepID=A0ABY5NLP0_9MICO|nr:LacI family DNA-binding transcriptional regulator [Microbacterium elymi]UUT36082.1 LacI family DNA-binding transcriptional regulator [Microbacterium elymi]
MTIGDVASAAGVSRSTASYALSGKRTISPEVRARVADAVRELGYTPNAGARALATSRTSVIALLGRFLSDEFAPAMPALHPRSDQPCARTRVRHAAGVRRRRRRCARADLLVPHGRRIRAVERRRE